MHRNRRRTRRAFSRGVAAVLALSLAGARVTAGITRNWGPMVGALLGDVALFAYRTNPATTVDPVNGRAYCGSRLVDNINTGCQAFVDAVGGALAEVGISLEPYLPVVISRGYRFSPASESYFAAALHGATSKTPVRWIVRGAVGKRTRQLHAGIAIDLDFMGRQANEEGGRFRGPLCPA